MSYGVGKKDNAYARLLVDVHAPKTVWMAIAYAFAHRTLGNEPTSAQIEQFIRDEWRLLHDNGIVPQRPR